MAVEMIGKGVASNKDGTNRNLPPMTLSPLSSRAHRVASLFVAAVISTPTLASAHDVIVYPANGQTPAQQDNDNYHCYRFAMQQTGYDPTRGVATPPPTANAVRGAAGGAALGAVGGAIGGNAGKGAAIGAGVGAVVGAARRHNQKQAAATVNAQARSAYNRAFGACMVGRGYTVG